MSQLAGSVFKRTPLCSTQPSNLSGLSQTGFPIAQHQSKKSAFVKGRDKLKRKAVTKYISVPVVQPASKLFPFRIDKMEITSIGCLGRL